MASLFVANLPQNLKKSGLIQLFRRFGSIQTALVVLDKTTGLNRGHGFVTFENAAHAAQAIKIMNGYALEGKELYVTIARGEQIDEANLFVGPIPQSIDNSSLYNLFERFGQIVEAKVIRNRATGISRGCGFVRFVEPNNAIRALARMNGHIIEEKAMKVKVANFVPERAATVSTQVAAEGSKQIDEANLYVENLPLYINESTMHHLFEWFGPIVQAKVIMDGDTGISKGYGFVRFADPTHAAKAIARMNALIIEEEPIYVKVAAVRRAATVRTQVATEGLKGIDKANLLVSNLPVSLKMSGLVKLFERFGSVARAKVIKNKVIGISNCIGFVRFSYASNAAEAIKAMNGSLVEGKVISVKIACQRGSSIDQPRSPSVSMLPHLVPFAYEPGLSGSLAAQTIPHNTFPGPWSHLNGVLASGSDQRMSGPGVFSPTWSSVPTNGGRDMPQRGLSGSMAAQNIPRNTFPDRLVSMQQIRRNSVPPNGGGDMPQHGLNQF